VAPREEVRGGDEVLGTEVRGEYNEGELAISPVGEMSEGALPLAPTDYAWRSRNPI